ncbi:integrase, catalytic region, zinc finger, CCHC-type containing protein [Tanacetum coccineum]
MENKLKDPIAIEKKQNVRTIDYNKLNALYEDFVPQKELVAEQKCFSSTFIPFENSLNARTSTSPSETKPPLASMPNDIKEMKDIFNSTESDLSATWKQNELLNDQLLEAKLKHEIKLKAAPSVRRTSNRDSSFKNSFLSNTKKSSEKVVQIIMWIVDSGCSKHMTGLGPNLFSVGQLCDGDLEVAFRFKTCYARNLEGDDLLTGARESNLFTISISDMAASSPVCLMSKATSTKSWLWHHRLSHLNFDTINDLTKHDLVNGLLKFKYSKDHLCSACERGKSKKSSYLPKLVPSTHSKLELLHMDLCEPMRVETINGKRYILVLVDDYSRFTWVYF